MLEIACFELSSAEIALASVADRIEFCDNRFLGGLTPDIEEFKYLKEKFHKPIYVMIRPQGGDYFCSEVNFASMIDSIMEFKEAGADGFVFGILGKQNEIDEKRNQFLVDLAKPVPCTFHRAIDHTPDYAAAVQTLINIGFQGVLTSGNTESADEGVENLAKIIKQFGTQIQIIVGGGVRSENIQKIKKATNATWYHSSAILKYGIFIDDNEIRELKKWI